MIPLFLLAVVLAVLALILFRRSGKLQRESGLPPGRVIYSDTGIWKKVERPLFEPRLYLTGRPDYLVEQDGLLIPVEVKSAWAQSAPYEGHVFQLAAYCLLVDRVLHKRPPYGIIKYRNRTFAIDYTEELENDLLDMLADMRRDEKNGDPERSHDEPARCARCGYRSTCSERL